MKMNEYRQNAINHLKTHLGCVGYRDYIVTELQKLEKIENIITETENQHYELQGKKVVMSSLAYSQIKRAIEMVELTIVQAEEVLDKERARMIAHGDEYQIEAYNMAIRALNDCVKLENIKQIVDDWNDDASNSFSNMCKINEIIKQG